MWHSFFGLGILSHFIIQRVDPIFGHLLHGVTPCLLPFLISITPLLPGILTTAGGEFLCATGRVDADSFARENDAFYMAYQQGTLDIHAYLEFALRPIAGLNRAEVQTLQEQFIREWITPILLPQAHDLIDRHRHAGDTLIIITATNTVVTRPIADLLGIEALLGCEAELKNGHYTGGIIGTPSFQEGKVSRLDDWLVENKISMAGACFYSDSHNDLPLLERVDKPIAVDPDDKLAAIAKQRSWPIISLRTT